MERLQEALHRARERRNSGVAASKSGPQANPVSKPSHSEGVEEAWSNLKPFVPLPQLLEQNRIVSYFDKNLATGFDLMRTKVLQQAKNKNWRRIIITSPSPRCGKTMTTANLAFSLARQADLKVMVLELDLRRPSLARVLGIKEPHYFAKALAGSERPEDHLVRIGDNLAFGTNQAAATDPSELLQSSAAQNALEEIEATYQPDILLFDSAPMLASDDTFGFLKNVDAALIVAAAEQTTIEEIDVTEAQVAEATEVMGVVLNKCRYAGGQYGYSSYGAN